MVKVLFLPLNYGEVIQSGVYDAFRDAGCELEVFDYFSIYEGNRKRTNIVREQLITKVTQFKPDLIHMQIQHTTVIDFGTILKIKKMLPNCTVVNWTGDVRNNVPGTYRNIAKHSDYNFISSTGQLEMFKREVGKEVKYLQIGYDPKLYFRDPNPPKEFEWDCIFVANNNVKEGYPGRKTREDACKLLRAKFGSKFALFGHGWPKSFNSNGSASQRDLVKYYHRSLCSISISHFNDISHYFSDRLLMCMASGRPTISYRFPNWESYFTNNCDLLIAESVEDIANKVMYLKNNRDMAEFIGKSGAEKVYAEHTYSSRIRELLDMVKK